MKIRLYSKPIKEFSPEIQVCLNRGIEPQNINKYLNNSFDNINPPEAFGEELLKSGVKMLIKHIADNHDVVIIVDSDVDGWTSSALLINYLYECFPAWTETHLFWVLHEGKQHGLSDHIEELLDCNYSLVICPDSATNDVEYIKTLHDNNIDVLILDHHLSDVPFSEYAITINSQYNYPNSQLSGVGVVYQFCKYIDKIRETNIADKFIDLVAIGLMGDMMDIRNLETKELMFKGFMEENIKNPLIYGLREKAEFALSKADYAPSIKNNLGITPMGAAFFIIPLLNALSRSGTMEEKELVFESMITFKAFKEILSNKRGHKSGEMERKVDQALRTCTNVKNRQTRAEDSGMEILISRAEKMLDNKVLVFPLEYGEIDPNIAGLVANKLMSKYQRPVCVIIKNNDIYQGSMRGYTATGIDDFKAIAETSPSCAWCRGHENAAGICITDISGFISDMNTVLKDMSNEIVYYVDYIFHEGIVDENIILKLSELNDYLGTGFARPLVYVDNCVIDNYMIMKDAHLKINLNNKASAIMWGISDELKERIQSGERIKINFVAKCNTNEWAGEKYPQLIIEDWEEVIDKKNILDMWGL